MDASKNYDEMSILEIFEMEASGILKELETLIMRLEQDTSPQETLRTITRLLHTIKGGASTIDCQPVKQFSHAVEEYLEPRMAQTVFSEKEADYLLRTIDWLKYLVHLGIQEAPFPENMKDLYHQVESGTLLEKAPMEHMKEVLAVPDSSQPSLAEEEPPSSIRIEDSSNQTAFSAETVTPPAQNIKPIKKAESQRIETRSLDKFLNLSGELYVKGVGMQEFKENMLGILSTVNMLAYHSQSLSVSLYQPSRERLLELGVLAEEIAKKSADLKKKMDPFYERMDEFNTQMHYLTSSLQDEVMHARMVPLTEIFDTFPRMVRDLAKTLGKKVQWLCEGAETRIDKAIIEVLRVPMEHLIRNALDHGIKDPEFRHSQGKPPTGTLKLTAYHHGDQVVIHLEDDGQGLDLPKIRTSIVKHRRLAAEKAAQLLDHELLEFIFLPGFTTQDQVTTVSGRGVGMDIVKTQIEKLNGQVRVETAPLKYTRFTIILPLTLSVTQSLLIESFKQIYAFPTSMIGKYIYLRLSDIQVIGGISVIREEGQIIPIAWLRHVLGYAVKDLQEFDRNYPALLFRSGEGQVAIIGDRFVGEEEIVIKSLDSRLKKTQNLAGASILNNGRIALVLDVPDLLQSLRDPSSNARESHGTDEEIEDTKRILVIEDSLTIREIERKLLVSAGYQVVIAVDGLDGLNKIRRQKFDAIITDIDMPRMNGLELTHLLKSDPKYQQIPIIIVSYKDRSEDQEKGLKAGADHYIPKNQFDNEQFLATIQRCL